MPDAPMRNIKIFEVKFRGLVERKNKPWNIKKKVCIQKTYYMRLTRSLHRAHDASHFKCRSRFTNTLRPIRHAAHQRTVTSSIIYVFI